MLDVSHEDLVRRAQKGDVHAIGKLYDHYQEQIFRFVWSRVGNRQLAEDITGEVFTRMVVSLSDYELTSKPFHAWLYQISRNLVIDTYRRQNGRCVITHAQQNLTGRRLQALQAVEKSFQQAEESMDHTRQKLATPTPTSRTQPTHSPTNQPTNDRRHILKLLKDGLISVEQAELLLAALDQ